MDEIFNITRNPVRAKALKEMAKERIDDIKTQTKTYKIIEEYYEILKELMTALMYIDGYKTLSHKMLISYIEDNYKEFNKGDIIIIDELRKLRNNIVYYGQKVEKEFLINNKEKITKIINLFFNILEKKFT